MENTTENFGVSFEDGMIALRVIQLVSAGTIVCIGLLVLEPVILPAIEKIYNKIEHAINKKKQAKAIERYLATLSTEELIALQKEVNYYFNN